MPSRHQVRRAVVLTLTTCTALLALRAHSPVGAMVEVAARRLAGLQPEPDAGPIPPGTPAQPSPLRLRSTDAVSADPLRELQALKRRAERLPGPSLGPASRDAARFRHLMDQWRGAEPLNTRATGRQGGDQTGQQCFHVAGVAQSMSLEAVASPVAWGKLPLHAGQPITLEARAVSGGPPLLYLIRSGQQVAYSGERNAAPETAVPLTYTPALDGDCQFLVRGRGDGPVGTCDLYVNGQLLFRQVKFGGTAVPATWNAGDEFQTAHLPSLQSRVGDTVVYAFDGQERFVARNDDGGVNGCSRLVLDSASANPSAHFLVACASQDPADGGPVRVYANPLSQGDADGDHLADPLETALGTDPRSVDTDGDGLRDDWELFGIHTPSGDEDLPSYADPWGPAADPNRMDLFVELDWMAGADADPERFRLTDAAFDRLSRAFRAHGRVAVHLDLGQMGARASRGGQSFAHQSSFYFTGTNPACMQDLWSSPNQFAPSRRHLFVYGVSIDRFSPSQTSTGEFRRIYENGAINTSEVWSPRFSPGFIICNGTGIYNMPVKQSGALMHELGHCLSLRHGGNVDTNNKPNYISVMNYLFTLYGLDDTGDVDYSHGALPPLDEGALSESAGIGVPLTQHLYQLIQGPGRGDIRGSNNRAAIDWNSNKRLDWGAVSADIDGDGALESLADFDDWQAVRQPARGFGWVGMNAGVENWTSSNNSE